MTNEEELDKLEMQLFMLEMKDTWFTADYKEADMLRKKIRELKKEIENENK